MALRAPIGERVSERRSEELRQTTNSKPSPLNFIHLTHDQVRGVAKKVAIAKKFAGKDGGLPYKAVDEVDAAKPLGRTGVP